MRPAVSLGVTTLAAVAAVGCASSLTRATGTSPCRLTHADYSRLQTDAPAQLQRGKRVAVLGDSYSTGYALPAVADDWVFLAARREQWRVTDASYGGTGYTKTSGCPDNRFASRLSQVESAHPQLVLVEGSLNDAAARPATVQAAATSLYRSLRTALPRAHIVAIGPSLVPSVPTERLLATAAAVRSAANDAGVRYLDASRWLPARLVGADGAHPTVAGQRAYAHHIETTVS